MWPVTQTKTIVKDAGGKTVQNGNCYPAALASILNLPLHEVPNFEIFYKYEGRFWEDVLYKWLEMEGWKLVQAEHHYRAYHATDHQLDFYADKETYDRRSKQFYLREDYYFVSGKSPRDPDFNHIVIYQGGFLIHDPHPSRDGLATEDQFEILTRL